MGNLIKNSMKKIRVWCYTIGFIGKLMFDWREIVEVYILTEYKKSH
jgi:lipid-A-disaccharide synthase-like uncharacterized protein